MWSSCREMLGVLETSDLSVPMKPKIEAQRQGRLEEGEEEEEEEAEAEEEEEEEMLPRAKMERL